MQDIRRSDDFGIWFRPLEKRKSRRRHVRAGGFLPSPGGYQPVGPVSSMIGPNSSQRSPLNFIICICLLMR